jgi:hypothetical protein
MRVVRLALPPAQVTWILTAISQHISSLVYSLPLPGTKHQRHLSTGFQNKTKWFNHDMHIRIKLITQFAKF